MCVFMPVELHVYEEGSEWLPFITHPKCVFFEYSCKALCQEGRADGTPPSSECMLLYMDIPTYIHTAVYAAVYAAVVMAGSAVLPFTGCRQTNTSLCMERFPLCIEL